MNKTNKTGIHKHVLSLVLVAGLALFFGLVVYPKIAYERGEEGTSAVPKNLAAEVVNEHQIILTWEAPSVDDFPATYFNVYYGLESGSLTPIETKSLDLSYTFEDLEEGTEYFFAVSGVNGTGEGTLSDEISATTEGDKAADAIAISAEPVVESTDTTATIYWETNVGGSSIVYYGPLETVSGTTPEYNTLSKVTGHSVELTNLVSCMQYWFKVASNDASSNNVESVGGEFETTGCQGDSEILAIDTVRVTNVAGASVQAKVSGRGIEVVAPAALKSGISQFAITAMKLEKQNISSAIGSPSGKNWAGETAFSLKALEDEDTEFDGEFDQSVDVSIDFTSADIAGLSTDSLKIYHYTDGIGWEVLSNCTNDYNGSTGTITCETTSFSIFGLFGDTESGGTSSGSNPSGGSNSTNPAVVTNVPVVPTTPTAPNTPAPVTVGSFTKDLSFGMIDSEVKMLQKFLNKMGFTLSLSGAGSVGNETEYFGPRTRAALIRFQEAYKDQILTPTGLMKGTGFFGIYSRNTVNSLK